MNPIITNNDLKLLQNALVRHIETLQESEIESIRNILAVKYINVLRKITDLINEQ